MDETEKLPIKSYLMFMFGSFAALLIAVLLLNVWSDPYYFLPSRNFPHPFPHYEGNDREIHYNLIAHMQPSVLYLGDSRTQYGLPSRNFLNDGRPTINGAFVNATVSELFDELSYSESSAKPKIILIGLSYEMAHRQTYQDGPLNREMVISPNGNLRLDQTPLLFSYFTMRSALTEILRLVKGVRPVRADGFATDQVWAISTRNWGGLTAAVRHRIDQSFHTFSQPGIDYVGQLRKVRDLACQHGTRLHIYLTPVHAVQIELIDDMGQRPQWEAWKRATVAVANERPGCHFDVWDFNRISAITTEPFPPATKAISSPAFPGYWDGIHFRPWVGDIVLDRMAGRTSADASFGTLLTPATIDNALTQDRIASRAFERRRLGVPDTREVAQIARQNLDSQ